MLPGLKGASRWQPRSRRLVVVSVLKLTGVIAWSWVWVLSPLWISAGFTLLVLAIIGIALGIAHLSDNRARKKALARRAATPGRPPLRNN
jgi:hypothetical protein